MTEPRKAAAGIILTDESDPRVLLVRRSDKLRFMAGHHAFPGGRIDDNEGSEHVIDAPSADEAPAIHAVAREIFEETGILCARGKFPGVEEIRRARRAMLAEEESFDQILARLSMTIHAEDFEPAGLWITPKISPIRFHTRYYLHRHRGEEYEELIDGEIVSLDWMRPTDARRQWREGSILLPAPVAYVLQQLEAFPFPAVLDAIRRTTHVQPETPGRIEYQCGIYALPLKTPTLPPATSTNCVVVGEKELFVIDPGTPFEDEQANLKHQLDHLLELGGRIGAVILTHGHPDHVGAAEFVRNTYDAPIWAHQVTAGRVDFRIDRYLTDGEVIAVAGNPDWRLRVIHTPGHDPGHLCFLEETTRTLLCGDMVADQGTIVVSTEHGGDMTEYLNSLERLRGEEFDFMLPAHGLGISKPKDKIRDYIKHRLEREEKVKAALAKGLRTMDELLPAVYEDVPQQAWPLAKMSLNAHLRRLGRGD